ncbi:MAG: 23S rRNA (adenine(2503)-C(2))-methyltransferase RlmN [Nitrospinae bacterium]|nr:23S rRNA (adenine(2503)-C(2))-methyltransferase RlmN [Nitrospinota bacterium]
MQKINLKDLSIVEMEDLISSLGEKPYRAKQVFEWVFQKDVDDIAGMTNLSLNFRNRLNELSYISRLSIADKRVSKDGAEKYLFLMDDGNSVESVLIPDKDRLTLCISTQVGCKLNCAFCLTGKGGFIRNLRHSEIIEQVLAVKREMRDEGRGTRDECDSSFVFRLSSLTNIVLMGMGEPLDNYENSIKAIKTFVSPHGLKIPARRITLSTSGLIPEIKYLANENLKINLAVSLNATNNETRDKIMPLNKKYPIENLLKVLREYPLPTGRRITFEYVIIKDINDSIEDADRLSKILKGIECKINLIPLNPPSPPFVKGGHGGDFEPPPYKRVEDFQNLLISRHYTAIIRKSKGADIYAACGQLRGMTRDEGRRTRDEE